uniref:Uncharacterized protein n=1 Tax=Rhizophora mucronata TaxID=61149 RepID=A0A2P2PB97_RHIMU
MASYLNLLGAT